MKRYYLLILALVLTIVCTASCLPTGDKASTTKVQPETSSRGIFEDAGTCSTKDWLSARLDDTKFTVDYPPAWTIEIVPFDPGDDKQEGVPLWGIRILVDGDLDQSILVFQSHGHSEGYLSYPRYSFNKNDGSRMVYSYTAYENQDAMHIAMTFTDHPFNGVLINVDETVFNQKKTLIFEVIKRIRF